MDRLQSNITRTNSRYRGTTELDKYMNFIHEVTHDIKLLGNHLDRNDFIFTYAKGQTDFIDDNMAAYYNGSSTNIIASINTATQLNAQKNPIITSLNLQGSDWVAYGSCTKSGSAGHPLIHSDGTATPSGVSKVIDVIEGQLIYLRMLVSVTAGTAHYFTIGSVDVNSNIGSLTTFDLPLTGSIYIGHVLHCQHKESITINIDVARGGQGVGTVGINDLSITLIEQKNVTLQPLNTVLKSRINILEEKANNILNNL